MAVIIAHLESHCEITMAYDTMHSDLHIKLCWGVLLLLGLLHCTVRCAPGGIVDLIKSTFFNRKSGFLIANQDSSIVNQDSSIEN